MECQQEENKKHCNCTYDCSKKGICCKCLKYHFSRRELPGCCFPNNIEKTYDRSFEKFVEVVEDGKI